ncbi:hypothetical protein J3R83DRAFT_4239 [Lanmaoa asiatica]|nr:hypothetical protein J3R83DRAFT_4239 [Lanmaoa asiatica]
MQRIDPLGWLICSRAAIQWRVYEAPRSNYVWHIDGHHKLIRWGFVIHGIIDGFCRTVVGLHANTDNRAQTVLALFLTAIEEYGTPSRVRGDRGGENIDVAVWMIEHRGHNRSSFLWGRSTRNSRIERLWVDLGINFVRRWRAFFIRLEDIHMLDVSNAHHLWLLQHLFLGYLNDDCQQFQRDWNHHPISKRGHNQSPLDMRFLSAVQNGVYAEPENSNPTDRYSESDGDSDGDSTEVEIIAEQSRHVGHPAINVPSTPTSPFHTDQALEVFRSALHETREQGIIPLGYGVAEDEWTGNFYPEIELITVGHGNQEYTVELPFMVWWPRSVLNYVLRGGFSTACIPSLPMSPNLTSESSGPCLQFVPGAGRNGDRCSTCHKKEYHHHHLSTDSTPVASSFNPPPHSFSSTNNDPNSAPGPAASNTVQAIINRYATQVPSGSSMQLRPRATPTPTITRSEASSGFRKKVPPVSSKSKNIGRQIRGASRTPPNQMVKVGAVVMLPHGLTKPNGNTLRVQRKPEKPQLESYRRHGLMVDIDGTNDLEFDKSWSMVNVDIWFRRLLPKPFKWLDATCGILEIHWVLLNSSRQKQFVLTRPAITGRELNEVKGPVRRDFTEHILVIAPRIPIPRAVYTNWDKAIQEALSHDGPTVKYNQTAIDEDAVDLDDSEPEAPDAVADDISEYSFSNPSDSDSEPRHWQSKDNRKGKAKATAAPESARTKDNDPAEMDLELSESDESGVEIITGGTSGRDLDHMTQRPAVVAMSTGTSSDVFEITDFESPLASETAPRVFADLPLLAVPVNFQAIESSSATLPVIETQLEPAVLVGPGTHARLGLLKCHTSPAFETNRSQPGPSGSVSGPGGKRIKLDNYACPSMSPINEFQETGTFDCELTQATGSSSTVFPERQPSILKPRPARSLWPRQA